MPNHMPAPWTLANVSAAERGPVQIKSRHGLTVGTAYTVDDARVMAAAPELLAAAEMGLWLLERVAGWEGDGVPITKFAAKLHGDQMRAAIAKAGSDGGSANHRDTESRAERQQAERPIVGGLRLLGCPHPTSCTSTHECMDRTR